MSNFITTNIRLDEVDYIRLKNEALQKRKSLSALIRDKLGNRSTPRNTSEVNELLNKLDIHAKRISKKFKEKDGSYIIREMRDNPKW